MPPPQRVLEEFYKSQYVEQIEQSKGRRRSGYARVQLDGEARWAQQYVVLDVGADCAVVCLSLESGKVKPANVLSSSHYSTEPLDSAEAQGPSDFCFQLTDFGSSPALHHLFCVDSAEDRDGWLDAFDAHGAPEGTVTGFSVTDMTGRSHLPPSPAAAPQRSRRRAPANRRDRRDGGDVVVGRAPAGRAAPVGARGRPAESLLHAARRGRRPRVCSDG